MHENPVQKSRLIALTVAVMTVNTWLILNLSEPEKRSGPRYQISWKAFTHFRPVERTENAGLPARLMPPDSNLGKQPLVVYLHGAGERGNDNLRQLQNLPEQLASTPWRKRFPCFVLAPQCPRGSDWSRHMPQLEALIDRTVEEHQIDRSRIYLTGFSMGGFGSWELAAQRPELFAAVIPICGGGDPKWASRLSSVPIWAVHGDADKTVPVDCSRKMINAVKEQGGTPRYTELRGVGHDSWSKSYRDSEGVLRWMFSQRKVNR